MKMKHVLTGIVVAVAAGVLGGSVVGHADADYDHAIGSMPPGLPIEGYFHSQGFMNSSVPNSAKTVNGTSDSSRQAVQINDGVGQVGSVWAERDKYYFDFTKDQRASMWMYFGNKGAQNAGDGMAFVIQNDWRGEQAIAANNFSFDPAIGQTLGVWGYASSRADENELNVARRAIQHSWALEFDTFTNMNSPVDDKSIPGSFDFQVGSQGVVKVPQPHIASNYPAVSTPAGSTTGEGTYKTNSFTGQFGEYSYTRLQHNGLIKTPLSDGAWHHVTIDYKAPTDGTTTGNMTYTINDKQLSGSGAQEKQSETVDFDYSLLKDSDIDGPHEAKSGLWGFTGTTSNINWENNLVVFEQIPGLVDANGSAKIYNRSRLDTSGQPTEVSAGQNVTGGDRLRLDYQLQYNTGRVDWDNIAAEVHLPDHVTVNSGTITYANGKTETVDLSNLSGQNLSFKLGQLLNTDNRTATISLEGKADNPANDTSVVSQTSKFSGPNAIATADTPAFNLVHSNVDFNLKVTSAPNISLAATTATPTITGNATLSGTGKESTNFTLHPVLNGQALKTISFPASRNDGGAYTGNFTYKLPNDSGLKKGANTLTLTATDDATGHESTAGEVILNVGELDWGIVNDNSSFKDTTLTGIGQTVPRNADWHVEVNNQSGANWKMMAALTTPFANQSGKLAGNLIYQPAVGEPELMSEQPVAVADRSTDPGNVTTDICTTNWKADTGMLLKVNGGATAGDYQGQITWTLVNAA
ncbi:hypothetical protein [Levilactobacillus andaensis]|uniref:hypothetical protein n=1 Tax=Levilactobacillus andaensis TaxID=2799570 RepID=UPI0019426FD8|nr:hypothetical protein [Levilactobacillus andaensis]